MKDAKKCAKLKNAIRRGEHSLDSALNYSPTAIHPRHAPWNSMCASMKLAHAINTTRVVSFIIPQGLATATS